MRKPGAFSFSHTPMTPPSQKRPSWLPRMKRRAAPASSLYHGDPWEDIVKVTKLLVRLLGCLIVFTLCDGAFAQTAPTPPILLKGAPMGAVKFDHTSHLKVAGKCEICHHASKPEKPLKAPQE